MTRKEEIYYIKKGKKMEILENILGTIALILTFLICLIYWVMK